MPINKVLSCYESYIAKYSTTRNDSVYELPVQTNDYIKLSYFLTVLNWHIESILGMISHQNQEHMKGRSVHLKFRVRYHVLASLSRPSCTYRWSYIVMSSSPTSGRETLFFSFKVPQTKKACQPRLWVMAAAYRKLPWSLLSSTPENEAALSPHPLEGM